MGPIRHAFSYLKYIRLLSKLSEAAEEKETLAQVEGLLKPLEIELSEFRLLFTFKYLVLLKSVCWRVCCDSFTVEVLIIDRCTAFQSLPRNSTNIRLRRQAALDKIHDLERSVENWDSRDVGQCCNEFVRGNYMMYISAVLISFLFCVFLSQSAIPIPCRSFSTVSNHFIHRLRWVVIVNYNPACLNYFSACILKIVMLGALRGVH